MKVVYLMLLNAALASYCLAQKPPLGLDDYKRWMYPGFSSMSNDGKFFVYGITNKPAVGEQTVVLSSIDAESKIEFVNAGFGQFSQDSRYYFCLSANNQMITVALDSMKQAVSYGVKKYSLGKNDKGSFLFLLSSNNSGGKMLLVNLKDKDTVAYQRVNDYWTNETCSSLILKTKVDSTRFVLKVVSPETLSSKTIFEGGEPVNVTVDPSGQQILFRVRSSDSDIGKDIWYFNTLQSVPAKKMELDWGCDKNMVISRLNNFNADGSLVFCTLSRTTPGKKTADIVSVNNYTDANLKYLKRGASKTNLEKTNFLAVVNMKNNKVLQIEQEDDRTIYPGFKCRYQLVWSEQANRSEWNWNEKAVVACSLVDLATGMRKLLTANGDRNAESYRLSPSGKWIVYFSTELGTYFSYNVETGKRTNLTGNIKTIWTSFDNDDIPVAKYLPIGVAGFSNDENAVYIYDQYDIYQADLSGRKQTFNLTNGYGKRNSIVFRFAFSTENWKTGPAILTAFNRSTKDDGFFEIKKNRPESLRLLTMEQAVFAGPDDSKYLLRLNPRKAENAAVFLVSKMKSDSGSNLYATSDFIAFKPVTNIYNEKEVNWLTSELINFKTIDGNKSQGILYRPENFDPRKKYPIVIYLYEKISECLNLYPRPDFCTGPMSIPYFASNGYLVFTPDIHFKIGYPGRSSFNTVMGALDSLVKLPFVDSTRMGIQGHSFGGFQVNYIVTHTNRFAAACSAAGFTNFVSAYGSVIGSGYSRQGQYELYRDRIGATLWERPDLYMENSPVLLADKVKTPLLMMHNMDDDDVPVTQGIEFFTGLRRLGKVAYLLQYEGEGHMIINDEASQDYCQKMREFFDYFLKGSKLPGWMVSSNPINNPSSIIKPPILFTPGN